MGVCTNNALLVSDHAVAALQNTYSGHLRVTCGLGVLHTGAVDASRAPSRRITRTASTAGAAAVPGPPVSHPSTAAPTRQLKRRLLSCPVDAPSLFDVKLDGKLAKLEQVLELQPWYKPPPAGFSSSDGGSAAATATPAASLAVAAAGFVVGTGLSAVAGDNAADAGSSSGMAGKKKGKKHFKQLEFTLKAAAVLAGHEPLVMPQQLQQWAMQVSLCFKLLISNNMCTPSIGMLPCGCQHLHQTTHHTGQLC